MLYEALQILTNEVNDYLDGIGLGRDVVLENIAKLDSGENNVEAMEHHIVLTLLTIDEETTLKNFPNYQIQGNQSTTRNNKVNLNLYVLFSSNKATYIESLKYISKVIAFFQGKNYFTQVNSNQAEIPVEDKLHDFRFTMELYTPSFEDLNYIWGTLGGKQFPSALYKLSLITINRDNVLSENSVIEQVSGNLQNT